MKENETKSDSAAMAGESVEKVLGIVKSAVGSMKNPITMLALSKGDEAAIGDAIKDITNIVADLAKEAFKVGAQDGAEFTNRLWFRKMESFAAKIKVMADKGGPDADK